MVNGWLSYRRARPLIVRLIVFCFWMTISAHAQERSAHAQERTGRFVDHVVQDTEGEYKYVVFVPAAYRADKPSPAILFLHGAGERGRDNRMHLTAGLAPYVQARAKTFPFLVVFPQCSPTEDRILTAWQAGSLNGRRAIAAFEDAQKRYRIDPARVVLTGWSMGGYGAWSLGMAEPSRWSAIVPIAGGGDVSKVAALKGVPVWAFHGTKDKLIKIESNREMVEGLKAAGGTATITELQDDGHYICDSAFGNDALLKWMLDPRHAPAELGSVTVKPVAAVSIPFVPAVEIPQAAAIRLGNDALAAMSYSIPQTVPKDMLTGRINDMFDSTVAEGRQFGIRFSGITYAGQLERVVAKGYGKDRLLVQMGLRNLTLTIGGTSVSGVRHFAQAGPIQIVIGHRYPVWLNLELTPFIADRKLRLKQLAAGFQIPHDNWYVTQPAGVSVQGFGMTEEAVVSGLTGGLYGAKGRIEKEVLAVIPRIVSQIEKNLVLPDSSSTVAQSEQVLKMLWPLPITPPRLQVWPEQIVTDESGMSLVVGLTASSLEPFGPAKPLKRAEAAGASLKLLPADKALRVMLAPQVLTPLTEMAVEADQLKLDLLDIPEPLFANLASRATLQEIIPDLKRYGEDLQVRSTLRVIRPLVIGDPETPASPEDGVKPLEFRAHGIQVSVFIKADAGQAMWQPCATFDISVSEGVRSEVRRPAHDLRQIRLNWLPTTSAPGAAMFMEGYTAKDSTLDAARYGEQFKAAWQTISNGGTVTSIDFPDLTIGASKLRLHDFNWMSPVIDVTYQLARIKITNLSQESFTYETKAPTSPWGEPLTLKSGDSHEFEIPYPLTYRRREKSGTEIYTLNVGTHSEFRVPLTGGPPKLFAANRP